MIVVDANVLAYAVLPGERTEAALQALEKDAEWVAPSLWRSEVRNVLATTMRLRGLSLEDALTAFRHATRLVIDAPAPADTGRILTLARRARASAYDCEYVALAEGLDLALVTGDGRLAKLFPEVAVTLSDFASQ
jgi:predicted nucleic acid-binding protein